MTGPADLTGPTARNAALFDALADDYDAVGVEFFGPIAQGLVDALAPVPGEAVADLGCGKGAFLLRAADRVGRDGRVVGVDIAAAMVEHARRAADDQGLEQVQVRLGDAARPDLPPGGFDVVAASLVLFFLPEPPTALAAWRELLAPGGRLGISTFGTIDDVWRHVDDVFTPYLPPAMLDARTSGARGPFASDEGVAALLAGAGFTDVSTVTWSLPVRFADVGRWHAFTMSTGQRAMWAAVPPPERDAVRAEAAARLAAAAQPDGSILLRQQVRYTLGVR